jgi:hypothetical protein
MNTNWMEARTSLARAGAILVLSLLMFATVTVLSGTGSPESAGTVAQAAPVEQEAVIEGATGAEPSTDAATPDEIAQAALAPAPIYTYWAKLVCGIQRDQGDFRLAVGAYATTINIGNSNGGVVKFSKTLALAIPPGFQKPGMVKEIATDKLPAGGALATDCVDVQKRLFPGGLPGPYIDGFVVIRSPEPLEVTGVYSTGSLDKHGDIIGNGGIDIEPVAARIVRPQPTTPADLIVSQIGAFDVSCPTGGGSCVTKVEIKVSNVGGTAAGPFKLRVVLDPASAVVVIANSAGLAAGATQSFMIVTPPGGNCYDPDCTVCATADSANEVIESNEANNQKCASSIG